MANATVHCAAPAILPRLHSETNGLGYALIRLSLYDDSDSSKAALFSLLSLTSLVRDGVNSEAFRFKGQALQALQRASRLDSIQENQAIQHIAASLLLCGVEVSPVVMFNNETDS